MFGAPCSEADLKESRFSTPPLRYLQGALLPAFVKRPGAPQEAYPGAEHRLRQVSPTFPPSEQRSLFTGSKEEEAKKQRGKKVKSKEAKRAEDRHRRPRGKLEKSIEKEGRSKEQTKQRDQDQEQKQKNKSNREKRGW